MKYTTKEIKRDDCVRLNPRSNLCAGGSMSPSPPMWTPWLHVASSLSVGGSEILKVGSRESKMKRGAEG